MQKAKAMRENERFLLVSFIAKFIIVKKDTVNKVRKKIAFETINLPESLRQSTLLHEKANTDIN